MLALQFLRQTLNGFPARRSRWRGRLAPEAGDAGIEFGGGLRLTPNTDRHPLAEQENRLHRVAVNFEQRDPAANRYGTGRRIECDVLLFADLAANVAKHTGRDGRRQIAGLFLRIVNEFVDDDLRVARHRQGRLIGEQQLRLTYGSRLDPLVADDIVTDQQLAQGLIENLPGGVGIDRCGDTDLFRLAESRGT